MFENKLIKGVHITRYIMSWIRAGGTLSHRGGGYWKFENWLKSLGLDKDEIHDIMEVAYNGKLELENSAREFIATQCAED